MLIRKMPLCRFWAALGAARAAASPGGGPQNPAGAGRAPQAAVRKKPAPTNRKQKRRSTLTDKQ